MTIQCPVTETQANGPGPSCVPTEVREAYSWPVVSHLDPTFLGLMDETFAMLRTVFQTENEVTIAVPGTGTEAMQCAVFNLIEPDDTVVICSNGAFGGRMRQMMERVDADVRLVEAPWGEAIDPEALRAELEKAGSCIVFWVDVETSTGVKNPTRQLAAVAKEFDCLTIVDAVTSLGGLDVNPAWGLDVVYSCSQKCLMCSPVPSPITFSADAISKITARRSDNPIRSWYLDIGLLLDYFKGDSTGKRVYRHTTPITCFYGLYAALKMILEEGLEAVWARHELNHQALLAGLEVMGLELLPAEGFRAPMLNAVKIPESLAAADGARVKAILQDTHGVEIGAGIGDLQGQIWRIGLLGDTAREDKTLKLVRSLGETLRELNWGEVDVQAAVYAAEEVFVAAD